jgi:hypothetical protein
VNGQVAFNPLIQLNRPGLLLLNGIVYVAFASHCDVGPYHGWLFGYDATTLEQKGVHLTTPDGNDGGIWQGGVGLTAGAHDLYYVAGNGTYDGTRNFGEGVARLVPDAAGALSVGTSFAPFGTDALNHDDVDIGSVGALLIPDSNFLVTGDKAGNFFLVRRDQMGGRVANDTQIAQKFRGTAHAAFGGLAYFEHALYVWGANDVLKAYHFDGTKFDPSPRTNTVAHAGERGGQISISSDGPHDGVVWTVRPGHGGVSDGAIQAFDAADITHQLWNSENDDRDHLGALAKFAPPTVVAGKVFLGTASNQLVAYGLRDASTVTDASVPDGDHAPESGPATVAPKFHELFRDFLGPGTPGHCPKCHTEGTGGFTCGTLANCWTGLVTAGVITPQSPLQSQLIEDGASPLAWFGGFMPTDAARPNAAGRAAVKAWVEAGAKND